MRPQWYDTWSYLEYMRRKTLTVEKKIFIRRKKNSTKHILYVHKIQIKSLRILTWSVSSNRLKFRRDTAWHGAARPGNCPARHGLASKSVTLLRSQKLFYLWTEWFDVWSIDRQNTNLQIFLLSLMRKTFSIYILNFSQKYFESKLRKKNSSINIL